MAYCLSYRPAEQGNIAQTDSCRWIMQHGVHLQYSVLVLCTRTPYSTVVHRIIDFSMGPRLTLVDAKTLKILGAGVAKSHRSAKGRQHRPREIRRLPDLPGIVLATIKHINFVL